MKAIEMLEKGRELIDAPEHWCQIVFAEDSMGNPVLPESDDAVKWCAYGALLGVIRSLTVVDAAGGFRFRFLDEARMARDAMDYCASELDSNLNTGIGARPMSEYNDHPDREHADIMNLYDMAMARL